MEFLSSRIRNSLFRDYSLVREEETVINKWIGFSIKAGLPAGLVGAAIPLTLSRLRGVQTKNRLLLALSSISLGAASLVSVLTYSLSEFTHEIVTTDTPLGEAARGIATEHAYEAYLRDGGDPNRFVPPSFGSSRVNDEDQP